MGATVVIPAVGRAVCAALLAAALAGSLAGCDSPEESYRRDQLEQQERYRLCVTNGGTWESTHVNGRKSTESCKQPGGVL